MKQLPRGVRLLRYQQRAVPWPLDQRHRLNDLASGFHPVVVSHQAEAACQPQKGRQDWEVCGAADLLLADLLACGPLDALSASDRDWLRLLVRSGTQHGPCYPSKIPVIQANPQFRMDLLTGIMDGGPVQLHPRPSIRC